MLGFYSYNKNRHKCYSKNFVLKNRVMLAKKNQYYNLKLLLLLSKMCHFSTGSLNALHLKITLGFKSQLCPRYLV